MGLDDRDYMRRQPRQHAYHSLDSQPGFTPVTTFSVLVLVLLVSILWQLAKRDFFDYPDNIIDQQINADYWAARAKLYQGYRDRLVDHFTLTVKEDPQAKRYHCFVTHALFESGVGTLIFHAVFFAFCGAAIERIWGPRRTLLLVITAAVASGGMEVALAAGMPRQFPEVVSWFRSGSSLWGLSAVISALAIANIVYHGTRRLYHIPVALPAVVFFGIELTGLLNLENDLVRWSSVTSGAVVGLVFGLGSRLRIMLLTNR